MAWMWWLLAPVATTAFGALVLWFRALTAGRPSRWRRVGAIGEHHRLLDALGLAHPAPAPTNVILVASAAEAAEPVTDLEVSAG
jgi:hypothetical protein